MSQQCRQECCTMFAVGKLVAELKDKGRVNIHVSKVNEKRYFVYWDREVEDEKSERRSSK